MNYSHTHTHTPTVTTVGVFKCNDFHTQIRLAVIWIAPQITGVGLKREKSKRVRRRLMWCFTLLSFAFRLKTLIQRVAKEYREHFNR